MSTNLLTDNFSEPLNGATAVKFEINAGDGNLIIDRLMGGEQVLASGTLQYFEKQGQPIRALDARDGQATFTLEGGRSVRPWFHFPWAACNGATEWQIHLNSAVLSDITAHINGGNVKLNLAGMAITCVSAETGGGNMDVILPEGAANLNVTARTGGGNVTIEIGGGITGSNIVDAKSGAGNVIVHVPSGVAARIHASTGLGKAIVDPQFSKTEVSTYQSPDFDSALNKIEIALHSGAGNVVVNTK